MRRMPLLAVALGVGTVFVAAGCGQNVCDRSDALDTSTKTGDCQVSVPARPFGAKAACNNALPSCSDSDKKAIEAAVSCWEALPVCASASQADWVGQANRCYAKASGISEACANAFFGTQHPWDQGDGGEGGDAGVDAGPQPDLLGTGALDIVATADTTRIAFAWTSSQPGNVDHWEVHPFNAADLVEEPVPVSPATSMMYQEEVGQAVKKKYFVVGLTPDNAIVQGSIGGPEETDAGMEDGGTESDGGVACTDNFDCSPEEVCNLNVCAQLKCQSSNICPSGYACDTLAAVPHCKRTQITNDGGIDAGTQDAGVDTTSRPFVSELAEITTAVPTSEGNAPSSEDRLVTKFQATNIDVAAIDTARQFIIMEQSGNLVGYYTQNRGKTWQISPIDNNGAHPKVAFVPASNTLYACYNSFGGVRVRRSSDYGRTWKTSALDLVNPPLDDGGSANLISDCAIAPWKDGQAAVVALDGDKVSLWTVNPDGSLAGSGAQTVFSSSTAMFSPSDLALATLPEDFTMHVLISVTRLTQLNTPDKDVIDMYKDDTTNGFVGPKAVNISNAFDQYAPTVVIDPVTKRPVAAWVSKESVAGGTREETVYLGFWMPKTKEWATGSDLNVFAKDKTFNTYKVMTQRTVSEDWEARAPSLAVNRDGHVTLSFMAGKVETNGTVFHVWSVPFGFDADNKILEAGIKGWFVPPAIMVSQTRVSKPSSKEITGPVVAADQQISVYYGFVEGAGPAGDIDRQVFMVSNPK